MITGSDKLTATPYKLIMIGDSCTGKSSLLLKLVDGTFSDGHKVTIGVDFKAKYVLASDTVVKLKIWDTAGQERFRSIIRTYYHGVHGIVLVFDLTNKESFDNLQCWIKEIHKTGVENSSMILIGNKCDLTEKRKITQKEISNFIEDCGLSIKYFECSSKLGTNVNIAFVDIATQLLTIDFPKTQSEKMELGNGHSSGTDEIDKQLKLGDYNSSCCVVS